MLSASLNLLNMLMQMCPTDDTNGHLFLDSYIVLFLAVVPICMHTVYEGFSLAVS